MFSLGKVVYTRGIAIEIEEGHITGYDLRRLLLKHQNGSWGDLCVDDKKANDFAVTSGERVMSSYTVEGIGKVWIITEWDRSVTTILLSEEY